MAIDTKWYIIAGAPGSGKTTVAERLASLGYAVVPEAARAIIDKAMKKGEPIGQIRGNEAEFQKKVFLEKIRAENRISPDKLTFIDGGGLPASLAYYVIAGLIPSSIMEEARKRKYRGVFFLEQLPYEKDYARTEDEKTARALHGLLYETYQGLGCRIIRVPVNSVEERVKFILSRLDG
jgi:predicted ATPase